MQVHVEEWLNTTNEPSCTSPHSIPQCPKKLFDPRGWRSAIADGEALPCEKEHGGHFRYVLRKVYERWGEVATRSSRSP